MNTLAVLSLLVAVAVALPAPEPPVQRGVIPVLQRTEVRDEVGQYALSYLSGDGTSVSEQGALKPNVNGSHVLVKQGSFSYTSPEGKAISLTYTADEQGFKPTGDHIPVPVVA